MTPLKFDEKLHVGNRIIDREHAILIEHINTLQQVVDNKANRTLIESILEGLVDYTKTHFYVEEELMQALGYPKYAVHKQAHDIFRQTMQQLVERYHAGDNDVAQELAELLKNWLVKHILKIDIQLAEFLKGKVLG